MLIKYSKTFTIFFRIRPSRFQQKSYNWIRNKNIWGRNSSLFMAFIINCSLQFSRLGTWIWGRSKELERGKIQKWRLDRLPCKVPFSKETFRDWVFVCCLFESSNNLMCLLPAFPLIRSSTKYYYILLSWINDPKWKLANLVTTARPKTYQRLYPPHHTHVHTHTRIHTINQSNNQSINRLEVKLSTFK